MKILNLTLRNFKGVRNFTLETNGCDVSVFGENATGKTTLYDAFLWLLFDKDSQNHKDFEIKTLDPSGQTVHGLEHEVEATIATDKLIALRKSYKEKWTKKRGSAKAEFTGHTTDYYIDGVPVKKAEYEAKIAVICDEGIFKLLTNPTYFNEQLHWQKRREILLQVCGNISDGDVITSDPALSKLPEILRGRKMEDHRKVIAGRRAEINKELEKIPVRISEVENNLPDISGIIPEALAEDIAKLRAARREKQAELADLESGGGVAEKKRQLQEIEAELLQIRNCRQELQQEKILSVRKELAEAGSRVTSLQYQIENAERMLGKNRKDLSHLETRLETLRGEWQRVNAQQFEFEQSSVCPTCGQPLPEEKLAEAREKALAEFNLRKAARLEEINREGKAVKEECERIRTEISALERQIEEAKERAEHEQAEANRLRAEVEKLQAEAGSYETDPLYQQKLAEKAALEEEIEKLRAGSAEGIEQVRAEIARLDQAIMALEKEQAKLEQYHQGMARIEELKRQERELAAEFERLEQELYLCEQFVRRKVELLEEKINSRFELARFKLFNQLINGGIEDCCVTTYNGVPYPDLNNGAKIQVGLDIIRTLCEHYGFYPPIWIDNRESVVAIPEMKNQLINLYVSAEDKSLRVEVTQEEKILKEAV